jgi:SAM-dependent methyltransferase
MDLQGIKQYWQNSAREYGTSLQATTRTSSAKAMELDALSRTFIDIQRCLGEALTILEVGCGNGQNCLHLVDGHPKAAFTAIDFIEEMIEAANSIKVEKQIPDERLIFQVGNVLDLSLPSLFYDIVFTVRCLINLNTDALQQNAIAALVKHIKPGGYLLMIENSQQTYAAQNQARRAIGLPERTPAEFNHFFNEETLLPFLPSIGLEVIDIEDFISLHDLVLYVLVPMINGGKVDYDHPLVKAATTLNQALSTIEKSALGAFGQNRLYKCRKIG